MLSAPSRVVAVPITTVLTWFPAYYTRVLGYSLPDAALKLGTILIILSPAGVYVGGWLVDHYQRRGYSRRYITSQPPGNPPRRSDRGHKVAR